MHDISKIIDLCHKIDKDIALLQNDVDFIQGAIEDMRYKRSSYISISHSDIINFFIDNWKFLLVGMGFVISSVFSYYELIQKLHESVPITTIERNV